MYRFCAGCPTQYPNMKDLDSSPFIFITAKFQNRIQNAVFINDLLIYVDENAGF